MPTLAYLANLFPTPVEPYVAAEILELRRRGVDVIPCSVRRQKDDLGDELNPLLAETLCLQPLSRFVLLKALCMCLLRFSLLRDLVYRVLCKGKETPRRRLGALLHTWLGACLALRLEEKGVTHIHVHHGYFGSWIAMVAARLLGISFSMTLHGSDLLLHPAYLDVKLKHCQFCVTVSEFNRRQILEHYPEVAAQKIRVHHLGVDCSSKPSEAGARHDPSRLLMLAVGRLHPVKDHAFLIRACHRLRQSGVAFQCVIAGNGPEHPALEQLIGRLDLEEFVQLLGHVPHPELDAYYEIADLVVLTSRSEGIPLVLMEAMVREKLVLAPAITGIPELVVDGKTGFLYPPGSLHDFVGRVRWIEQTRYALGAIRQAARDHVRKHFNQEKNLAEFCDFFLSSLGTSLSHPQIKEPVIDETLYENSILQ